MKIIREYTPLEIIRQRDFSIQIAMQSPFNSAVQAQILKMQKMWESSSVLAKIATHPILDSVFPVTMVSFNFSSELDKLKLQEQQRIVDVIEQISLDDETEIIIPETLSEETKKEFITLFELLKEFWKKIKISY